jgi:hypothetical protein
MEQGKALLAGCLFVSAVYAARGDRSQETKLLTTYGVISMKGIDIMECF